MNLMKFLKDEEGQSMVEYGITLGGVAAVSYIAIVQMGDRTADLYAWMANHLPGGETDDVGQVRVESDGLVALDAGCDDSTDPTCFNADQSFAARNDQNFLMNTTLGSSAVYEEDWAE